MSESSFGQPRPGIAESVVMITGASKGLGEALAIAFSRAGANVSLCARNADALESLCVRIEEVGGKCLGRSVDVRDERAVAEWVHETIQLFGPPSTLINNASILGPRVPLAEFPMEAWRNVIDVNLTGSLTTTRAVIPAMIAAKRGSIINVSSGAAIPPRRSWGAYAVSKDAVEGLSKNLAAELDGTGVRVNVVDPGAMRTQMRASAYPSEDPNTLKEPGTIAPLFLWLASDGSSSVTGERFQADQWIQSNR